MAIYNNDCSYVKNGMVGINPKYLKTINTKLNRGYDDIDKFMWLIDNSHQIDAFGKYTNFFFPQYQGYHQLYKTAKEIQTYTIQKQYEFEPTVSVPYNYTASCLMRYVRLGLMDRRVGEPNRYSLPKDFFVSNDPIINFC